MTEDLLPVGPWTYVNHFQDDGTIESQLYILGADGTTGRDEFLRLLYGAQVSLEVGIGATLIAMFLGLLLGSIAGFFRGWIDTVISRVTEITMAFPYLLFVIALASTVGTRLEQGHVRVPLARERLRSSSSSASSAGSTRRASSAASRCSLREKEFVEAARMIGASDMRIVRSHIFPHLVGPLIVFSTLNVAAFIVAEAGLSFLGLGIPLPTASWGNLLADAPNFYLTRPLLLLWPGLALVLHDARVQPARRRSPRRVRSAQPALARLHSRVRPTASASRGRRSEEPVRRSCQARSRFENAAICGRFWLRRTRIEIAPTPSAN